MKQMLRQFLFGTSLNNHTALNIGWLLFRIHTGLSIAIHAGWPKMNTLAAPGWFNEQVAGLGFTFPSPAFWATAASWGEFVGGICIALGLLTRFNALQLAFQFFVISFLWYDNPKPLSGMYFQNTLFMCYVLVAFAGGGRFSLDKIIMNRQKIKLNAPVKNVMACFLFLISIAAPAQDKIDMADFKTVEGKWKGTLTYLDYTSNKSVAIPANTLIQVVNENEFDQYIYYTDEPDKNEKTRFTINAAGTVVNEQKLIERVKQADGSIKLVLESAGPDGNDQRPAVFRHILILSAHKFIITKMVRFEGEKDFFERHQYSFTR